MIRKMRSNLPVTQQLMLLGVILLLIFSAGFNPSRFFTENETMNTDNQPAIHNEAATHRTIDNHEAFTNVRITGQAAYVWDVNNQRALYKKNENEQLPLASLTKLMTALLAHEILEENDSITINQTAIRQDGASGLSEGETFDRLALTDLTLISSSNDGAYALAYAAGAVLAQTDPANAFVQAMNIRAKELGLASTYFKNPTGLDISPTEGGAYGTARDMAFLMEHIIQRDPAILSNTKELELDVSNTAGYEHQVENTNYYINEIPGLIGSKTGYTDLAGGNLAVAFNGGLDRPFIVVVLGSTRQERFSDVMLLVDEVQQYLNAE